MPLWRRIADDIERQIEAGRYREEFPGEVELAEEYGVSRGTVRNALRPLRDRGVITFERGRRPRVINTVGASSYGPIYSLHEIVRAMGMEQTNIVLAQRTESHPGAAKRLSCPHDTELFHLARIRLADGEPLAMDRLWIPAHAARPLLTVDFTDTALYKQLRDRCGVTLQGGYEELWSIPADPSQASSLRCDAGDPLFKIHRVSCYDATPTEFRETYIVGSRFSVIRSFGNTKLPPRCGPQVDNTIWWM